MSKHRTSPPDLQCVSLNVAVALLKSRNEADVYQVDWSGLRGLTPAQQIRVYEGALSGIVRALHVLGDTVPDARTGLDEAAAGITFSVIRDQLEKGTSHGRL